MTRLACPYCRAHVPAQTVPDRCPACGAYIAWLTRSRDFVVNRVDLWNVLRGQRQANPAFVAILALALSVWQVARWASLPDQAWGVIVVAFFLLHLILANGFLQMLAGFTVDGERDPVLALVLTLPGLNALAILVLNWRTWRRVWRINLPLRLLGYSEDRLLAAFARSFCRQCGYDLTGNVSGKCPECGTAVP